MIIEIIPRDKNPNEFPVIVEISMNLQNLDQPNFFPMLFVEDIKLKGFVYAAG
jgi:hypothetical protein